jgi:hypothetical protein
MLCFMLLRAAAVSSAAATFGADQPQLVLQIKLSKQIMERWSSLYQPWNLKVAS